MTSEPPPPPARRSRPGNEARRRALGLEPDPGRDHDGRPEPDEGGRSSDPAPARRESLAESLARIPDLRAEARKSEQAEDPPPPEQRRGPAAAADAGPAQIARPSRAAASRASAGTPKPPPATTAAPVGPPVAFAPPPEPTASAPTVAPAAVRAPVAVEPPPLPTSDEPSRRKVVSPPPPVAWWRRATFVLVLVALVAGIPYLGYQGYRTISNSTDGTVTSTSNSPEDPGFEAQVETTPTAVAIQYDDEGLPVAATFLALANGGGGAVVYVPLDTETAIVAFGVDRIRRSYSILADRPQLAREQLADEIGRLLNVGIDEVIDLGNAGWAELVAPVAPVSVDYPDPVDLGTEVIPGGQASLSAAQVGPYLAATDPNQSDLTRLGRHEALWRGWLTQVAAAGPDGSVPGEATAGIGRFARGLASGPITYATLPVLPEDDGSGRFVVDPDAVTTLVTETVAAPAPSSAGSRFSVRLLNGVSANGIPQEVAQSIVRLGGTVTVIGNGPSFGTEETSITYLDPVREGVAELTQALLGGTGEVRIDPEAPDIIDLTIILGEDVLGDDPTGSTMPTGGGATPITPTTADPGTTAPGGN